MKLPRRILILFTFGIFSTQISLSATVNLLSESWEQGNFEQWNSWGSPSPQFNSTQDALGQYSLDPNGDGSYHSGLVSKQMFTLSEGTRLKIDAFIESSFAWSELEFGLVDTNIIPTNPNTNQYTIASIVLDADTQNTGHKLYANFLGSNTQETVFKNELAVNYFDDWHSFIFDFQQDGSISISIDEATVFNSSPGVYNYDTEPDFAVILAGRSYGAVNNLYDNIILEQVPEPSAYSAIVGIIALCIVSIKKKHII